VGLGNRRDDAFYMWRLMNLTFYGQPRLDAHAAAHVHESPRSMTIPLTVLAAGSVLAGWIGVPKLWSVFRRRFARSSTGWSGDSVRNSARGRGGASRHQHRVGAHAAVRSELPWEASGWPAPVHTQAAASESIARSAVAFTPRF